MVRIAADRMRLPAVAAGLVLVLGCLPPPELPPPIDVADGVQAEYLVNGSATVSALAAAADGRVFYTEKETGQIRVIRQGVLLPEPVAAVPVNAAGDRGLLGIALHPRFRDNGRIYVFYARSDTGLTTDDPQALLDYRVVYFELPDGADTAAGGEVFVASVPAGTSTRRIGGRLLFLPDRTLLAALGDQTVGPEAQVPDSPLGKLLRYNDNGTLPDDNPTAGSAVYARGLREPRGLALDPESGAAFVLEQCAGGVFELDRVQAGANYGWPVVSGRADTPVERTFAEQAEGYLDPLFDTGAERVQLAGLGFNPGTKYGPAERLRLHYGDSVTKRILSLALSADRASVTETATFAAGFRDPISDVAFTPSGTLYVACGGAVLRLRPLP